MRVLYVTHNGIGTALVQSQVLPYLRLLEQEGHEFDLVSFEGGQPFPPGEFQPGRWHPLRPRAGRSIQAKITDIAVGTVLVARIARLRRVQLLHARSYVPAAICWLVGRITGVPYLFDMRGFLPDEYVDAGLWDRRDLRYRAGRIAERHLLRGAAEIVVLTHAARRFLRTAMPYAADVDGRQVDVIPCGADLVRFKPLLKRDAAPTLVYSGSLGTWYMLSAMLRVYARARTADPALRFLFLNRTDHALIREAWRAGGLPADRLEIRGSDYGEMPAQLGRAHVGIALVKPTPSKVASSPIKVAEYLACGLPVIVNAGVGDSDDQVRRANAGHVMESLDDAAVARAGEAMCQLVADLGARQRARQLAETLFDVRTGAAAYDRIYSRLSQRSSAKAG